MRCLACGAEMHLMHVVQDETMLVPGYEHRTFMCSACGDIERRLVFARDIGQSPTEPVSVHTAPPISPAPTDQQERIAASASWGAYSQSCVANRCRFAQHRLRHLPNRCRSTPQRIRRFHLTRTMSSTGSRPSSDAQLRYAQAQRAVNQQQKALLTRVQELQRNLSVQPRSIQCRPHRSHLNPTKISTSVRPS